MCIAARRTVVLLAAQCAAALPAAGALSAQVDTPRVALSFNWPVGLQGRLRIERSVQRVVDGKADTSAAQWEVLLAVASDPADTSGRRVMLRDFRAIRNGQAVTTASGRGALDESGAPYLRVSAGGDLVAIEGIDPIVAAVAAGMRAQLDSVASASPGAAALFQRVLGTDRLKEALATEWRRAVAFWTGATLKVGVAYEADQQGEPTAVAPEARVPIKTYFAARRRVACTEGGRDSACAHLVLVEEPQVDSMTSAIRGLLREMLPAGKASFKVEHAEISRRMDLVTDPASMIPRAMARRESFEFALRSPGDSVSEFRQLVEVTYDMQFGMGPSQLRQAAAAGNNRIVAELIRRGHAFDEADGNGETPLYLAAARGRKDVVTTLVRAGASGSHAYALARSRGELDAMRLLRPHAADLEPLRAARDSGITLYHATGYAEATAVFAELALAEKEPGDAHAWLARAVLYGGAADSAVAMARAVLRRRSCHAMAHHVLATAFAPWATSWAGANADSSLAHADRALACEPANAGYLIRRAWLATLTGDTLARERTLDRIIASRSYTAAGIARARWVLESLPERSLMLVGGATESLALLVAQRQGVRPDVAVVDIGGLTTPKAARPTLARVGVTRPLPDAAMDSIGAGGGASLTLARAITAAWRRADSAGTLGRPLVLHLGVSLDSLTGPMYLRHEGTHWLTVPDSGPGDPRVVWAAVRRVPPDMHGEPTDTSDHDPQRRGTDVYHSVFFALATYLGPLIVDPARFTPAQITALDSIADWFEREVSGSTLAWKDDARRGLADTRTGLSNAFMAAADFAGAVRQAQRATQLHPRMAAAWNNLGYPSLLLGRLVAADSAFRRAHALEPATTSYLNIASVARLTGNPDTALAWLRTAEAFATRDELQRRGQAGSWTVAWLPLRPGDTTTIRRTVLVQTVEEKQSLIHYNAAISLAMRGDLAAADAALATARRLAGGQPLLCYAANLMEGTRGFTTVAPAGTRWLLDTEAQLRRGGCAQPR